MISSGANGIKPSLRAGVNEIKCPSLTIEGGKKNAGVVNSSFLHIYIYSDPPWIGRCPPTLGRSIYFAQFIDPNANLIWKHLSKTHPEIIFNLGAPWPSEVDK